MSETGDGETVHDRASRIARAAKKHQAWKKTFGLPIDEQFADEFHCALRKTILLQGRLFIFEQHFCFHSNIFGLVTNHALPISTVAHIQKASHLGFPNSIIVHTNDGLRYFLTSFLSREDAFRLMTLTLQNRKDDTGHLEAESESTASYDGNAHPELEDDASSSSFDKGGKSGWPMMQTVPPTCPTDGKDPWSNIVDTDISWVSMQQLLDLFSSQDHPVFEKYHAAVGDTGVVREPWGIQAGVPGKVRSVSFTSIVNAPLAPPTASCNQTQRAGIYAGNVFVLESEQSMPDVPYGERFRVEFCWTVSSTAPKMDELGVHLKMLYHVKFIRRPVSMIASTIVSGTISGSTKASAQFLKCLKDHYGSDNASSGSACGDAAVQVSPVQAAAAAAMPSLPEEWRSQFEERYILGQTNDTGSAALFTSHLPPLKPTTLWLILLTSILGILSSLLFKAMTRESYPFCPRWSPTDVSDASFRGPIFPPTHHAPYTMYGPRYSQRLQAHSPRQECTTHEPALEAPWMSKADVDQSVNADALHSTVSLQDEVAAVEVLLEGVKARLHEQHTSD